MYTSTYTYTCIYMCIHIRVPQMMLFQGTDIETFQV